MAETIPRTDDTGSGASSATTLHAPHGRTTIAEPVVDKVAGIVSREVVGVHAVGGRVDKSLGAVAPVGDPATRGVSVEAGEREAAVDVTIVVEYGESIPRVAQQIRDHVSRRTEGITGLRVTAVNVSVDDLHVPGEDEQGAAHEHEQVALQAR